MAFRQRDEIDRAYQLFEGSRNAVADTKRQLQLAEAFNEVLIIKTLCVDLRFTCMDRSNIKFRAFNREIAEMEYRTDGYVGIPYIVSTIARPIRDLPPVHWKGSVHAESDAAGKSKSDQRDKRMYDETGSVS